HLGPRGRPGEPAARRASPRGGAPHARHRRFVRRGRRAGRSGGGGAGERWRGLSGGRRARGDDRLLAAAQAPRPPRKWGGGGGQGAGARGARGAGRGAGRMTLWQGSGLGLVQGLTELLPVSSSGHLRVLEVATGVHTPGVFVEVALHVATLGSVLVVYGARLWAIARGVLARRPAELRTAGLLVLATLPAGVIGVAFHRQVEAAASLLLVGAGFIVTGVMNWSTRRRAGARPEPTVGVAVGIGFAQALAATFRGVSRSGSTVC